MQFIGTKVKLSKDFESEEYEITFKTNNKEIVDQYEELKDIEQIDVQAKKYRKKRSLDANAYCWVLCDKIAKKVGNITKEEVYKDAISNIGTFEPMIAEEKNFEKVKRIWENQGLGFLVKEIARKNKCVKFLAYYGSSTYDSKEMSLLIELVVQQAKELGIETMTSEELKSLLNSWH